jgi:predicted GTPase
MSQKALPSLDSTHTLTPINTEKINYNFFSDDEESTEHHLTATSKINNTITTKTRNTRKIPGSPRERKPRENLATSNINTTITQIQLSTQTIISPTKPATPKIIHKTKYNKPTIQIHCNTAQQRHPLRA